MSSHRKRSILVTGCSSGIGRHCALRLHEEGWRVFAGVRNEADAAKLQRRGMETVLLDYAMTDTVRAAFAEITEATGGQLDALFNNGAYAQAGAVEDLPVDILRNQFEANFFGWHELTRLAIPLMRARGSGRLVHCSSVLGVVPYRWRGAYIASKYALEGLMSTLRLELRGTGLHVCLIQPGPIVSKLGENGLRNFQATIDIDGSVHAATYRREMARLAAPSTAGFFRKTPEAVYIRLRHALNARRPRAVYPVTPPTWFMFAMRRLLPVTAMDWIATRFD